MPARSRALGHEADGVVALRVHHHQRALAARDLEHLEQLAVVQDEIVIGHEHLEGGVPGLHEGWQLLAEHLGRRLSDDEMKADIDVALPLRLSAVLLNAFAQRRALDLERERQDAGVAARGSRRRARGEVVRRLDVRPGRLGEMDVAVDPARHDEKARGVNLTACALDLLGNRGNPAGADADIGAGRVRRCDHRTAANGDIKLRHRALRVFSSAREATRNAVRASRD